MFLIPPTIPLIRRNELPVAMLDGFAGQLHSCLRGEHETVAEAFRAGQTLARFFGRVLRRDRLLWTEGDDADVPLALFFGDKARERANGILADHVRRGAVVLRPAAAPEIHDISGATLFHEGNDVFGAQKSAAEIRLNDAVPKVFAQIAHTRPARNAPVEMRYDAGVVDQGIDLAEAVGDVVNQPAHVFLVAHVGGYGDGFAIELLKLAERFVHTFGVGVGENDFRACFGERDARRAGQSLWRRP